MLLKIHMRKYRLWKEKRGISLNVEPRQVHLIERAAALKCKPCNDFMSEVPCKKAHEILSGPCLVVFTDDQFETVEKILEQPLSENNGFKSLMSDKYSW
ncbi:uncharacterized protein (DUF1778 family) [Buttiauxella sp. BIGb0552]|nr:uncharacterized protein (DUF1778 family) [Buttiauxella sp. BIGb0552]